MRKEFAHMKRCDIRKLLHERFPNAWLHLTLCCIRYGPALKHREDRHCGEHTQNLRCCIEGLGIHALMKECHKNAMELWASGVNNIRVTCICDGSMDASVGIAAILQHVYQQRGYNSKGPYHIDAWPKSCWHCEQCQQNVEKDTLLSAVTADFILGELKGCLAKRARG